MIEEARPEARLLSEKFYRQARAKHIKEAGTPNPVASVGEEFWKWQHRYEDDEYFSRTKPTRSDLAPNPFWTMVYGMEDETEWEPDKNLLNQIEVYIDTLDEIVSLAQEAVDTLPDEQRAHEDLLAYLGGRVHDTMKWRDRVVQIRDEFEAAARRAPDQGLLIAMVIERLEAENTYTGR